MTLKFRKITNGWQVLRMDSIFGFTYVGDVSKREDGRWTIHPIGFSEPVGIAATKRSAGESAALWFESAQKAETVKESQG